MPEHIVITGARENNLKDVDLRIPKGLLTVFTGVSGSGKSSIVFDTVAVESQRQLNETFTWFVRNRLPKYERPHADGLADLTPAIVVDQKPVGGHSRSTVGTMTDVYSVLRVLFSRYGTPSAGAATAYSFNDPSGMCPECDGLGRTVRPDYGRILDGSKSLADGAIVFPPFRVGTFHGQTYVNSPDLDAHKPVGEFTAAEREFLLRGRGGRVWVKGSTFEVENDYEGLADRFDRLYLKRDLSALSQKTRDLVQGFLSEGVCPRCAGARLNEAALASRIDGLNIAEVAAMEVADLIPVLARIDDPVAGPVAAAAVTALERIEAIGLGYLSLDRPTPTLSGGEGQRLKMVRHLGSSLTGMTYIFDEPSVGLHPRDVGRLNDLLLRLRDKGNTVLVVEHDPDVIAVADHVVDMGPGAGTGGGQVVYEGTVAGLRGSGTLTGRCLGRSGGVKERPRTASGELWVRGAELNNLGGVTVAFPTGVLTAVTGVAGSGKSSLVSGAFTAAHPDAVVVDQSAVGISARSTPATYLGIMDSVRKLFARETGGAPGLFSFNSRGACEACQGRGVIYSDLAFMDPVTTSCEACAGRRFKDEVLRLTVGGRSVADVLEMTAGDALDFFADHGLFADHGDAGIRRRLRALRDVGLTYLTLGQPLGTLSGGERQRIKLATQLHRTGAVYVLDEPTTGLHMADVDGLMALLDRLVDDGNTVLVVEHNLDVVRRADWIIDLGPDGGKHGGHVVFEGTPAQLLRAEGSFTAEHLRRTVGV
ncbi:ATP-binding cassette domain-containing protein [Streptomyces sp. YC537]|uniref:UvrABC system protein A n=1 Tax=Streptomyces boluensis TaxID=1775135 RepID=A0A964UXQ5_9ACTN|nr:ATP-binding cassette domain-containing protein [Streptomyces boluensis]